MKPHGPTLFYAILLSWAVLMFTVVCAGDRFQDAEARLDALEGNTK